MKSYPLPSGFDEKALKAVVTEHLVLSDLKEIERAIDTVRAALELGEGLFRVAPSSESDRLDDLLSHLRGALNEYNALSLPSILSLDRVMHDANDGGDLNRHGFAKTLMTLIETMDRPIEMAKEKAAGLHPIKANTGPAPNWQSIALAHACSNIWVKHRHERRTNYSKATHLGMDYSKQPFGMFVEAVWSATGIGTNPEAAFSQYEKRKDLKSITQF